MAGHNSFLFCVKCVMGKLFVVVAALLFVSQSYSSRQAGFFPSFCSLIIDFPLSQFFFSPQLIQSFIFRQMDPTGLTTQTGFKHFLFSFPLPLFLIAFP